MTPGRFRSAVLGASGYIGQHFGRLLADHPEFGPPLLIGSERVAGAKLSDHWVLTEPVPEALADARLHLRSPAQLAREGLRVVFSALPSGAAGAVESELARRGAWVFTNAADHRMDRQVPLLIPEVNADHLGLLGRAPQGGIVANPNCSTTGLAVVLAPIVELTHPRAVHVTTFQSLSGAGYPGVPSLAITDNVVPFIREEEEKMARETARILGSRRSRGVVDWPVPVVPHCARVGTREGHLEAVTLELAAPISSEAVQAAWERFDPLSDLDLPTAPHPPIEVRTEPDRPQPLRDRWAGRPVRARGMAVSVGRLREQGSYLRFFLLSHNAVRGGAGGSVLNAELVLARGLLGGRPG